MHPILQPEVTKLGVTRNPSVFHWYTMSPNWKFVSILTQSCVSQIYH